MVDRASLKGMNVALYARFSSSNQREESIVDQFRRLEAHVLSLGVEPARIVRFEDAAVSGAGLDRLGFQRLLAEVRAQPRRVDVIVVEDVSRLSRDQADALALFRELNFLGVRLICLADGISTDQRGSRLAFAIKSMFAQSYLEDLSDKTLRGLEGCALAGQATGGKTLGFRTRAVPRGNGQSTYEIEIDPDGAELVRRIFGARLEGQSCDAIAKQLHRDKIATIREGTRYQRKGWTHTTIRSILMNAKYIGPLRVQAKSLAQGARDQPSREASACCRGDHRARGSEAGDRGP